MNWVNWFLIGFGLGLIIGAIMILLACKYSSKGKVI